MKMINLLKRYAEESGTIVRSTSDLSPLEQWLIMRLLRSYSLLELADLLASQAYKGDIEIEEMYSTFQKAQEKDYNKQPE